MFIEGAEVPIPPGNRPYKLKETLKSVTPSGNVITTSKTVFTANDNHLTNGGEGVTDSALKELELRNKANNAAQPASKSTLIIHSVHRVTYLIFFCIIKIFFIHFVLISANVFANCVCILNF